MDGLLSHRLATASGIFLILSSLFWVWQPSWCFFPDGSPRPFGGGSDATLWPAWFVILCLAISSYVVMIWVRTGRF